MKFYKESDNSFLHKGWTFIRNHAFYVIFVVVCQLSFKVFKNIELKVLAFTLFELILC